MAPALSLSSVSYIEYVLACVLLSIDKMSSDYDRHFICNIEYSFSSAYSGIYFIFCNFVSYMTLKVFLIGGDFEYYVVVVLLLQPEFMAMSNIGSYIVYQLSCSFRLTDSKASCLGSYRLNFVQCVCISFIKCMVMNYYYICIVYMWQTLFRIGYLLLGSNKFLFKFSLLFHYLSLNLVK